MFGILNLNKPSGPTSRDCVNHIQRSVRPWKVGHAGTLDPMAEGVLLIAVGQAVRLVDWLHELPKTYQAMFELGRSSPSGDNQTEVVACRDAPIVTRADVERVIPDFLGEISQVPPAYSAVHVDGKRAYELARAGKSFELAPRQVAIHRIAVLEFHYPILKLEIACGTGTYIRSLGSDLAKRLGSDAVMTKLCRSAIGPYDLSTSIDLDVFDSVESIRDRLKNPVDGLKHMPCVALSELHLRDAFHGKQLMLDPVVFPEDATTLLGIGPDGNLKSILRRTESGTWKPHRNFLEQT